MRRSQIRYEDSRAALLRYTFVSLWAKDPPSFEDFMSPEGPARPESAGPKAISPEAMQIKLNAIMGKLGGVIPEEKVEC